MNDTRTRIPICPHCDAEISHKGSMYGQPSYVCSACNRYGRWTDRKTMRNPANPKRSEKRRLACEADA